VVANWEAVFVIARVIALVLMSIFAGVFAALMVLVAKK
jgi:hypothetical protein